MDLLERASYQPAIKRLFRKNRQMVFLMGPRQVGKTTLSHLLKNEFNSEFFYFNWDNLDHRQILAAGPKAIAESIQIAKARKNPPIVVFDEIHKYDDWKTLIKGFYDTYSHSGELRIIVTGSARLDVYNSGGDSLMGRYFKYRIHPFSIGELQSNIIDEKLISNPSKIDEAQFENLYLYGGFPEPFIKADRIFFKQWSALRFQQLFYEDIRDVSRIHEIKQMELLSLLIRRSVGSLINLSSLSRNVRVSIETVRRWINVLNLLYYCFQISPWSKNVTRSLLKEPKIYLWDWSSLEDKGQRSENFVASHLLKACHYWTDCGYGEFGLYFLRNKEKKEIDFLVARDGHPWFIAEVKSNSQSLCQSLEYFQGQTGAQHAFQLIMGSQFEDVDCFAYSKPTIVPVKTFLSQLV